MSDIRFNRWLHQSGTGGVYQDSSGRVGIGTSVPTTALDVQNGTIKIGSNTLSSTGVSTFSQLNVGTGGTILTTTSGGLIGLGTNNPLYKLSITDSSDTILRIDKTTSTWSGYTNSHGMQIIAPNMSGGSYLAGYEFGKALSLNNSAHIDYIHVADGSNNNYLALGFYNADQKLNLTAAGNLGIGTTSPVKPLDVRGEATFGAGITISDMNWGKDTYQQVYTFSGITGGSSSVSADGCLALVSPNANPSNTRIGSIVFGNKVSGTSVTGNPGIKGIIDCYTNTNVANAADTGSLLNFYTKPDNGNNRVQMTLNSNGVLTKPYQPAFLAYRNSTLSVTATWQLISNGILTESYDVGSVYSTSTNGRFVAPVAGKYMFYAGGYSAGSTNGERYAFGVKVNNGGSPDLITGGNYCIGDTPLVPYQVVLNLAANDYVELYYFSAISTTLGGSTHWLYWGGYLLG